MALSDSGSHYSPVAQVPWNSSHLTTDVVALLGEASLSTIVDPWQELEKEAAFPAPLSAETFLTNILRH